MSWPSGSDADIVVQTPLGFSVRISAAVWEFIVHDKHPTLDGKLDLVTAALATPDQVRLSRSAENVMLFYRLYRERRWACAVAKRLGTGDGFLITAYPASKLKQGIIVWPQ